MPRPYRTHFSSRRAGAFSTRSPACPKSNSPSLRGGGGGRVACSGLDRNYRVLPKANRTPHSSPPQCSLHVEAARLPPSIDPSKKRSSLSSTSSGVCLSSHSSTAHTQGASTHRCQTSSCQTPLPPHRFATVRERWKEEEERGRKRRRGRNGWTNALYSLLYYYYYYYYRAQWREVCCPPPLPVRARSACRQRVHTPPFPFSALSFLSLFFHFFPA
mmetsp:Transcript_14527/g.37063  ORF Transcript_14527/g.37063 Transcript_14527/m.37063 type:complete len:216 (-) Transcript_14527:567-1214(-)